MGGDCRERFRFSIMTNSVANNGNPFGAADYAKTEIES